MKCELCGTPVKVVGKTTQHYEPLIRRLSEEEVAKLIRNPPSKECVSNGPNGEVEGTFKAYVWNKPMPWDRYPEDLSKAICALQGDNQ